MTKLQSSEVQMFFVHLISDWTSLENFSIIHMRQEKLSLLSIILCCFELYCISNLDNLE